MSRGLDAESAVALIVNGFAREVLKQLPMEFAVEAQKLLGISLGGERGMIDACLCPRSSPRHARIDRICGSRISREVPSCAQMHDGRDD